MNVEDINCCYSSLQNSNIFIYLFFFSGFPRQSLFVFSVPMCLRFMPSVGLKGSQSNRPNKKNRGIEEFEK